MSMFCDSLLYIVYCKPQKEYGLSMVKPKILECLWILINTIQSTFSFVLRFTKYTKMQKKHPITKYKKVWRSSAPSKKRNKKRRQWSVSSELRVSTFVFTTSFHFCKHLQSHNKFSSRGAFDKHHRFVITGKQFGVKISGRERYKLGC